MKDNRGHRILFRIRVIYGRTVCSVNRPETVKSPSVQATVSESSIPSQRNSRELQVLEVYHNKDEWKARDESHWASYTPEMKLMVTVPGYDMIESPDLVSVRNDELR
jgi:hypothetical protein